MKIDYEKSLLGLINSIVAKFGLLPFHKPLPGSYFGEKFQNSKRVVLILIDALGYDQAKKVVTNSNLKYIKMPQKISSVFPSTTVNALTTLSTARSPIEHGMLGYILYLKEFGTLANMIEFSPIGMARDSLISRGANPSSFLSVPSIYEPLRNYGVNPLIIIPSSFKESGLSKLHNRGSAVQGYLDLVDMMIKLRKNLESEKFSYIYAYWPMVDAMGHTYGPNSEEYFEEAKEVFELFETLVYERLPSDIKDETTFLITADHGQIHTPWQHEYKINPEDEFVSTLQILPAGEPRVMYLYTKDPSKTIEEGEKIFGSNVEFVSSSKMIEEGLFGPGNADPRSILRIGDLVAIPRDDYSFSVKYTGNEHQMKGKHGGLSNQEMDIPLFVI
ncbi:alkaline phosphatase family protein [Athalassotoga saccharophila]|uniref:alkaline phosphatase family protein n=1 Tax=Athalassotoga saccharophila TaxID=1441386 RepID=UPI00137ACB33|nr:alkaline phosphatase family protein [Athalassotoga saccharophila]BBJ29019.1 alkaline phosphodiesterase I [Athalassotoga saccharophila]